MSQIIVKDVHKAFGLTKVLKGVSLELKAGDQCVISGASGSGKSTLLYLLGGLDQADKGSVEVDGESLEALDDQALANYRNTGVGFVFQFHFLLPSLNALDNILLPAEIGGFALRPIKQKVLELARDLGVESLLQKLPYQLSGGEQQRVNIIRALSLEPKLLLCDEPTGNLDSENSAKVTRLIKQLGEKADASVVVVTHDQTVAAQFDIEFSMLDGQLR